MMRHRAFAAFLLASTAAAFAPLSSSRRTRNGMMSLHTRPAFDPREAMQEGMDAWNAFLVQGRFVDEEREGWNEFGRMTTWQKGDDRSKELRNLKHQTLQWWYATKRLFASLWLAVTGRHGGEGVVEFLRGLRLRLTAIRRDEWKRRLGASAVAVFAVNMARALFTMPPTLLSVLAVIMGLVWPSWWLKQVERLQGFVDETRIRGRRKSNGRLTSRTSDTSLFSSQNLKGPPWIFQMDDLRLRKKPSSLSAWQSRDDSNNQADQWGWGWQTQNRVQSPMGGTFVVLPSDNEGDMPPL